jgi:hypothetical protein
MALIAPSTLETKPRHDVIHLYTPYNISFFYKNNWKKYAFQNICNIHVNSGNGFID